MTTGKAQSSVLLLSLDVETTGLSPYTDAVIQLAAVTQIWSSTSKGFIPSGRAKFSQYVRPHKPIPKVVTQITHITNGMVCDKLPFAEVWKEFCAWLTVQQQQQTAGVGVVTLLVGHNIKQFDLPILYQSLLRAGLVREFEQLSDYWTGTLKIARCFDLLVWCRALRQLKKCSLSSVHEHFLGKPFDNAHSALADASAVLRIIRHAQPLQTACWSSETLGDPIANVVTRFIQNRAHWVTKRAKNDNEREPAANKTHKRKFDQMASVSSSQKDIVKQSSHSARFSPRAASSTNELHCAICGDTYSKYFAHTQCTPLREVACKS